MRPVLQGLQGGQKEHHLLPNRPLQRQWGWQPPSQLRPGGPGRSRQLCLPLSQEWTLRGKAEGWRLGQGAVQWRRRKEI